MSICLGVDMSTQSCSGVLIDSDRQKSIWQHSIPYRELAGDFALNPKTFSLDGLPQGASEQPPLLFVECLDRLFSRLKETGWIARIDAISVSAQQHGHVYLNESFADSAIFSLSDSAKSAKPPTELLQDCFAYPHSPIWMTGNTRRQADEIRKALGGSQRAARLAGADVPLRFTGVIVRRIGQQQPAAYSATACIHLISSFLTALLSTSPRHAIDYGNASGMMLMDYRQRRWSDELIAAVAAGLPGGKQALANKLPALASSYLSPRCIGDYWIRRHGFSPNCLVAGGGGDNPHTKSLIKGDLLSLGTSFVYMRETAHIERHTADTQQAPASSDSDSTSIRAANGMYDGLDRPFYFFPRTNGGLVWDKLRGKIDYSAAEEILTQAEFGKRFFIWQPLRESFPVSPVIEPLGQTGDIRTDYPALVDTVLAVLAIWSHSSSFNVRINAADGLYVTGGASVSRSILQRISALWGRPVCSISDVGTPIGSALSAYACLNNRPAAEELAGKLLGKQEWIQADRQQTEQMQEFIPLVKKEYGKFVSKSDSKND